MQYTSDRVPTDLITGTWQSTTERHSSGYNMRDRITVCDTTRCVPASSACVKEHVTHECCYRHRATCTFGNRSSQYDQSRFHFTDRPVPAIASQNWPRLLPYFTTEAGTTAGNEAGALQLNAFYIGQGRAHECRDQDFTFCNDTLSS